MTEGFIYERACERCRGIGAIGYEDPTEDGMAWRRCEPCEGNGWIRLNGPEVELWEVE